MPLIWRERKKELGKDARWEKAERARGGLRWLKALKKVVGI